LTFWPSSVTSETPSAATRRTSSTIRSNGRLISGPRTAGTMQKAQLLSQPIWMVIQALWPVVRRAGSAEGNSSWSSATVASRISVIGPVSAAWCNRSTERCTLCVPITTST